MQLRKHRFLFLIEDYNLFYTRYFAQHPSLSGKKYDGAIAELLDLMYYQADSYAAVLRKMGQEAETGIMECNPLQLTWLKENDFPLYLKWKAGRFQRSFQSRVFKKYDTFSKLHLQTLKAQVEKYKPDVIFVYSGVHMTSEGLDYFKKKGIKLVLHWSCEFSDTFPYKSFDLIITSARQLQRKFTEMGIHCVEFQQAFDARIIQKTGVPQERDIDVAFVGNFLPTSTDRVKVLSHLSRNVSIRIFGSGTKLLPADSPIHARHRGSIGGLDLFRTYLKSKIALHIPNDQLADYAGAKRYFEVTGTGTFLLSKHQSNIGEYFKVGEEIVTFENEQDCLEKIKYYLSHQRERDKIAYAGQQRTLKDHSFDQRAPRLLELVDNL